MKKVIPFKKDIQFKNPIYEITSISLEHTLHVENKNLIKGEFIITGDYRITEASTNTENFELNLPIDIDMDDRYLLDRAEIDIDDFYYEIINDMTLSVTIETKIDKIEEELVEHFENIPRKEDEKMLRELEQIEEEILNEEIKESVVEEILEEKNVSKQIEEEQLREEKFDTKKEIQTLFKTDTKEEIYEAIKVYIVREGDSVETVLTKYEITREQLETHNDLKDIKIGDKLIIPHATN